MKKSQRGFVLVETLIVAVFVMGIFSLLYMNYYPLIGEYEKREVYDDVEAKYAAHWIRKIILEKRINDIPFSMNYCNGSCHIFYAAKYINRTVNGQVVRQKTDIINETERVFGNYSPYIQNYIYTANIKAILVTPYNITNFKNYVASAVRNNYVIINNDINKYIFNRGFQEYIDYLPRYRTPSASRASYRVIVIIDHVTSKEYDSYGTIEVKR